MSLNQTQKNIINSVKERDFDKAGIFLNGASPAIAKDIEAETLTKIGDTSLPTSDHQLIQTIANWNVSEGISSSDKTIYFCNLLHKSIFNTEVLTAHDEFCCTSTSKFLEIADGVVDTIDGDGKRLNSYTSGKFCIDKNASSPKEIYYIGENNKLYGKSANFGWSYSTSSAACVYGYGIQTPIVYKGYCFESMKGRTNYVTGGASRFGQYFFLTPGGGPVPTNNNYPFKWIIQFNEYNIRSIAEGDNPPSSPGADWVIPNGDGYGSILKLWIHFFFPNGDYVRAVLDRSDSANFNSIGQFVPGLNPSMRESWIYSDYSNNSNINFKSIWNNYVFNKVYRPMGGYNPKILDTSRYWNGKMDETIQRRQKAYDENTHALVWEGGGEIT